MATPRTASFRATPMRCSSATDPPVDRSASAGKVVFFNPSSTVVKAAALLAKDGLTRQDRIARWYANHPRRKVEPPPPLPADIAAIRAQIAATFPRDEPPRSAKRQ